MKEVMLRVIKCLLAGALSVLLFGFLGSFYKAADNTILANILVWFSLFVVVYFLMFAIHLVISLIFKVKRPPLIDGLVFASEILGVIIFTLAIIKDPDESLFLNIVFGIVAGVVGFAQLTYEFIKHNRKDD